MAVRAAAGLGLIIVTATILESDIKLLVDVQVGTGNDAGTGYRGSNVAVGTDTAGIHVTGMGVSKGGPLANIGVIGSACGCTGAVTTVAAKCQTTPSGGWRLRGRSLAGTVAV